MVVPARRSFLVGPVNFHGPCAPGRITVQVRGKITAPPSTAVSTWSRVRNNYWLMFSRVDGLLDGNRPPQNITSPPKAIQTTKQDVRYYAHHSPNLCKPCVACTFKFLISASPYLKLTTPGIPLGGQTPCVQSAPTALKLVRCNNLEVSRISSKDSPQMHVAILQSSGITLRKLTITAPGSSPNTDSIHIEQSQNVRVADSRIGTGDDCMSVSSGSRFVAVDGIECGPGHGVSIGSLGKNGDTAAVEFVDVRNVRFTDSMNGARIKTLCLGGQGYAKSISFTNIEFDNVDHPVLIDQFYRDRSVQVGVAISNVTYSNLRGTSSRATTVAFDCSGGCTDIHVNSMVITGPGGRRTVARCRNAQVAISGQVYPEIPCRS
ncbi:hypothetical protein GQ55_7G245800 [Panicum hallii var. hallii]|uniref:Polygalacturonase n=1 Tax=Panicum hallii var. hallii TaxID=1504633 RepID=A0A2T7CYM8_9POAL|nr:hypothetical protein GQ55_7G245800 [Panicum hallii var. hallii]